MDSLSNIVAPSNGSRKGEILKKVRFRDKVESESMNLEAESSVKPFTSWKDKLMGSSQGSDGTNLHSTEDF